MFMKIMIQIHNLKEYLSRKFSKNKILNQNYQLDKLICYNKMRKVFRILKMLLDLVINKMVMHKMAMHNKVVIMLKKAHLVMFNKMELVIHKKAELVIHKKKEQVIHKKAKMRINKMFKILLVNL